MVVSLEEKIKKLIVKQLDLKVKPEKIKDEEPLFGRGLGLDSIDSLAIMVGLDQEFGITLTEKELAEEPEKIFKSVKTLADFVKRRTSKK
ncbi:MAG: acyl carrier protein [Candidatus Margulisbacteria bacterium]|nr:acyl carrier protein [Candidatus Margulisiibacteriota bacterium]